MSFSEAPEAILERCGSVLSSQAVGPKLRWVAAHEPEVWARARRLFMPASWLLYRLTGQYALDHHSASQCTPMYDGTGCGPGLGALVAPAWNCHPALVRRDRRVGDIERGGHSRRNPVITGSIDAWTEAVSVDACNPGDLMLMYGTTMFLIATVAAPLRTPTMWGTVGAYAGSHNLAGGMATSGAITSWLRDLTGADYPALLAEAEASGPGAHGLLMLPYFAGERTPVQDPDARGVVAGLTLSHTRETSTAPRWRRRRWACATTSRRCAGAGAEVSRVVAVGGGVQGGLWTRIVSDVTGLPQIIPTTTIGALLRRRLPGGPRDRRRRHHRLEPPAATVSPRAGPGLRRALHPLPRPLSRHPRGVPRPRGPGTPPVLPRSTLMYTFPPATRTPVGPAEDRLPDRQRRPAPVGQPGGLADPGPDGSRRDRRLRRTRLDGRARQPRSDPLTGHGFISSQRMGLEVFKTIPPDAPLIVAEAVWQYSHHVLAGLRTHRGPILTLANFEGTWPGLVGLLGLNSGMTKMGVAYSTIWSVDFQDDWFKAGIRSWVETGTIPHDASHVHDLPELAEERRTRPRRRPGRAAPRRQGHHRRLRRGLHGHVQRDHRRRTAEPDRHLQGTPVARARCGPRCCGHPTRKPTRSGAWLQSQGMTFKLGTDEATELTEAQLRWQYKMYIAALRISDDYGLDAVGIQYQQGLKDLSPASDLAEGLLNNADPPPVTSRDGSRVLWDGALLPHFNEADEGVAVDALITNRIWTAMGLDPATTLHDVRWGEEYDGRFVWVFEISGSVPPSTSRTATRTRSAGARTRCTSRWAARPSRACASPARSSGAGCSCRAATCTSTWAGPSAVSLPDEETERRSQATTPAWPIMHAVFHGVSRDQFMARHKANHLNVAYAPDAETADKALVAKAALFHELGAKVHLSGDANLASR